MLILANGFAGRGAGSCAVAPPKEVDDNNGVVESYELKGQHAVLSAQARRQRQELRQRRHPRRRRVRQGRRSRSPTAGRSRSPTRGQRAHQQRRRELPRRAISSSFADIGPYATKEVTLDIALAASVAGLQQLALEVKAQSTTARASR
jgi:hypothetical protein